MNARKAKALRRALNFNPAALVEYEEGKPGVRVFNDTLGTPQVREITGTKRSMGARRDYQSVKRTPGVARFVLGASNG